MIESDVLSVAGDDSPDSFGNIPVIIEISPDDKHERKREVRANHAPRTW